MKTKILSYLLLMVILLLNACSPFTIARSSGEQPVPVESYGNVSTGYQAITVDDVQVEVGVGSPIPVFVHVSGNLPDTCSQVEYTEIRQAGTNFIIDLSATPATEGCVRDTLPFRMSIPLSVMGLPGGSYSATVNGTRAAFELDTAASDAPLQTAEMPISKNDIKVDSVNVEVGLGSPIPVHAIISATLPNACAQLGEVRLHQAERTFFVRLVAYVPAQTDCNPDPLPIRLEVPLNIVNLPEGPYEVNVNGTTASLDPRTVPAVQDGSTAGLTPIPVENVSVEIGIGSPLPVNIVVSGTWPSLCSQIAEVKSQVNDFQIDYTVQASTVESCPPDFVGQSFLFRIPLNIAEMNDGTYTITVNGKSTTFIMPADQNKGTAAILGWVWHDQCVSGLDGQPGPTSAPPGCVDQASPIGPYRANGLLDAAAGANELPIEGVIVRLFKGDCASNSLDQVDEERTIATDISYSFTELDAGIYCVYIDPQEEPNLQILLPGIWTYPTVKEGDISQTVELQPGEAKYNVNFGWDYQFK